MWPFKIYSPNPHQSNILISITSALFQVPKGERKADQEKLHVNRIGAGERQSSGSEPVRIVFNTSFQYINSW